MRRTDRLAAIALATALAGCSLAPPLTIPEVPAADHFKEAEPWVSVRPADHVPRERWWTVYRDADLDALQAKLVANSPDLAAAYARYQQSQAINDQARAGLFPSVSGNVQAQRNQQSDTRPLRVLGPTSPDRYSAYTIGLQLDYEIDFWGRVRNLVAASAAAAEASQADLESARLSLQAQLADSYMILRGLDSTIALLDDSVANYRKALEFTQSRHAGGIASGLDVSRAETQLEATRSQARQSRAQRAVVEHAIAALVGVPASSFAIASRQTDLPIPQVPTGVPAELLQRRPDIAAAERRVASANASIGVARAGYFPAVTLTGLGGFQSSQFDNLVSAPNLFWTIGPSLVVSLFDGGRRRAEVDRTRAVLDENGARYRGVVLTAFQQVEDNLALLNHYREASESERRAVASSQRSLDFATTRYREGAVNYLEVVTAQTAALLSRRNALDLDTAQRRASVGLIRALGGGWDADTTTGPVGTR